MSAPRVVRRAAAGIYPVVRESHLAEPETEAGARVQVANEQLVELFYLSAEAVGEAPSEGAPGAPAAEEESRIEEIASEEVD